MIEYLTESEGNVVGIKVGHKISGKEDSVSGVIPKLESAWKKHGDVRMLVRLEEDMHGLELSKIWDEARHALRHRKDYRKVALVGGLPKWIEWDKIVGRYFDEADIRRFDDGHLDDAWKWIKH